MLCFATPVLAMVEVRVGVLAYRGAEHAVEEWEPTLRHLAASLPEYRFVSVPGDLATLTAAIEAGEIDFVVTNSGHYVELESRYSVTRIATLEASDGLPPWGAIGAAVIVAADRTDLQSLDDLRGRRLAAVAPEAFGGFRVLWRELADRGIDPFRDVARLEFTGFPMQRVINSVAKGGADAGVIRACLFEQLVKEGSLDPAAFRVLEVPRPAGVPCRVSSRLYPEWPFARLASTPSELAKEVGIALLGMPPLTASVGTAYAWTVPVDYQPVHELFRQLKIGPYEYTRRRTLTEVLLEHWPWLLAAGLAVVWWVVHVARVEHLVRRRTEELKAAHETARRQREEMEHSSRLALLGEMASSLAHEINQPLAAIANYARGCERRIAGGHDGAGVVEGLRLIAGQAERAAGIVKRMRGFVRKRAPEPLPLDINEAVREALELFHGVAGRRGLRVSLNLAETLPRVRADRVQIEQVVLNLVQNAAEAMAGRDRRHLAIVTAETASGVEVAVTDNGPGLATEARTRLFEPFFTTKAEGLGLGLSLSRSIVEAHGGRLWAEDAAKSGACFRFTIPATTENS